MDVPTNRKWMKYNNLDLLSCSSCSFLFLFYLSLQSLHGVKALKLNRHKIQCPWTRTPQHPNWRHPSFLLWPSLTLKLTKENFLLWKIQFMPLIEGYGLEYLITQDPLSRMLTDEFGKISVNQEFKTWWCFDSQVKAVITSSLFEYTLSYIVDNNTSKEI